MGYHRLAQMHPAFADSACCFLLPCRADQDPSLGLVCVRMGATQQICGRRQTEHVHGGMWLSFDYFCY